MSNYGPILILPCHIKAHHHVDLSGLELMQNHKGMYLVLATLVVSKVQTFQQNPHG